MLCQGKGLSSVERYRRLMCTTDLSRIFLIRLKFCNCFYGSPGDCKQPFIRFVCMIDRNFRGLIPFLCVGSKNCFGGTSEVSPIPSNRAISVLSRSPARRLAERNVVFVRFSSLLVRCVMCGKAIIIIAPTACSTRVAVFF